MTIGCDVAGTEQTWNAQQLAQPVLKPTWRLWAYRKPSVVLGCSQRALLSEARKSDGIELLIRSSGGGAVLTGPWMLGLSVALPLNHSLLQLSPGASYRWLGELLAATLRRAGIAALAMPCDSSGLRRSAGELSWACFGGVSAWEVVVRDRKIAGLAQVRRRQGILLVGGLLLALPDWDLLCASLGKPAHNAAMLRRHTTSCIEESGTPDAIPWIVETLTRKLDSAAGRVSIPLK